MDILFKIFLALHIVCGATGLISGTVNIVRKKGGKNHKATGNVFLYSMLVAGSSALFLSVVKENYFLFIVGIFTVYMTGTGRRYLLFKNKERKPNWIDYLLSYGMLATALVFAAMGTYKLIHHDNFGIVFLVFGVIAFRFAMVDIKNYSGKHSFRNYWLIGHLQRMMGSYIAALTAFLVVNSKYLPPQMPAYVAWLFPTVVVVPLIFKWSKKYAVNNPLT